MSEVDLLVLTPWVVFVGGVTTVILRTRHRNRRGGRNFRRRRDRPRRR